MPTSATNELGKHPCKEELNGVVGKSTTKSTSLLWAYGGISKHEVKILPLTKNNCLCEIKQEMKTSFVERIGENLDLR